MDPVALLSEAVEASQSARELPEEVQAWVSEGLMLYIQGVSLERGLGLEGEGGSRSARYQYHLKRRNKLIKAAVDLCDSPQDFLKKLDRFQGHQYLIWSKSGLPAHATALQRILFDICEVFPDSVPQSRPGILNVVNE